jgi:NADH dehydrogenase
VYVTKFPGLDGQLRLIADWILDVFLPRDITQLQLFHEEAVHREHFEAGETVFAIGDFGDKVYFIVKGEAQVEREGTILAELKNGDVFGEVALISNHPRGATVQAVTALDVVVVSRDAFKELLGCLPGMNDTMQEIMRVRLGRALDLLDEMHNPSTAPMREMMKQRQEEPRN